MLGLAVIFGVVVGFALGMTGGGGGIFAVPLLVYGLAVAPREAVGISLAAVGGTAAFGAVPRLLRGEVELRTGVIFAVAGMAGAPIGSYLSTLVPEQALLVMFAILMLVVAWRMWAKARHPELATGVCASETLATGNDAACQRDDEGRLRLNAKCAWLLVFVGLLAGVLSGMFGVGGGFVIVPALVLFSGMRIRQAVATSLLVIVLVSISGVASYVVGGGALSLSTTTQFLIGGFAGMWLGGLVAKKLEGPTLQKTFAIAVVLVAAFIIVQSFM